MSLNNTRLQVQKILRTALLDGVSYIGESGWGCMEYGQASFQSADKILTMKYLKSVQESWIHTTYADESTKYMRRDETLETQRWQIQVILKRSTTSVEGDIVAEDVANALVMYLNAAGAEYLRKNGIAPLRIDTTDIIVYNDDSSVYQKRAVFTVKLQVPKVLTTTQDEATAIQPDILPI